MDRPVEIYGLKTVLLLMAAGGWILFGLFCAAFFVLITAVAWFFPAFMKAGLAVLAAMLAAGAVYTALMLVSAAAKREIFPFLRTRYVWMKYIVPVARSAAKRTGLDPDRAVWSFIALSNEFILNDIKNGTVSNIMLLLPHCLQLQSCGMKLTSDIRNCKKCGKCIVYKLIELSDALSVDISVASGGTMARKRLMEKRPDMVIAVACERDLLSGIRDTLPMPVIGVINQRPEGPCVNTTVDLERIAALVKRIKN